MKPFASLLTAWGASGQGLWVGFSGWFFLPLGTCSGIGVSPSPATCVSLESFGQLDLDFQAVWGIFVLFGVSFVFFILVILEASSLWHLTNFELVLSIKSIFIRLGPDWFVCCSRRGFGREGSHGSVCGTMGKSERILSLKYLRLFICVSLDSKILKW